MPKTAPGNYRGQMCSMGLALEHPTANVLLKYAYGGCLVNLGTLWAKIMMEVAIKKYLHVLALEEDTMAQLQQEVKAKVKCGQYRVVEWDIIKHDPPKQLKILPITMIPHKSRLFRAILYLLFGIKLSNMECVPSVNESSVKTAPTSAINQMGHLLA